MGNTVTEIDRIKEMLNKLPESALSEVGDFVAFLLEEEKKRKALVESVHKAEQNHPLHLNLRKMLCRRF
jgi:hypothetical protein